MQYINTASNYLNIASIYLESVFVCDLQLSHLLIKQISALVWRVLFRLIRLFQRRFQLKHPRQVRSVFSAISGSRIEYNINYCYYKKN